MSSNDNDSRLQTAAAFRSFVARDSVRSFYALIISLQLKEMFAVGPTQPILHLVNYHVVLDGHLSLAVIAIMHFVAHCKYRNEYFLLANLA